METFFYFLFYTFKTLSSVYLFIVLYCFFRVLIYKNCKVRNILLTVIDLLLYCANYPTFLRLISCKLVKLIILINFTRIFNTSIPTEVGGDQTPLYDIYSYLNTDNFGTMVKQQISSKSKLSNCFNNNKISSSCQNTTLFNIKIQVTNTSQIQSGFNSKIYELTYLNINLNVNVPSNRPTKPLSSIETDVND